MTWQDAQSEILKYLSAGAVGMLIFEIIKSRKSLEELNIKLAVFIEKTAGLTDRVSRIEMQKKTGSARRVQKRA